MPAAHFLFIGIVGAVMVLVVPAGYGPGVSTDAVHMLSTADNLAAGDGFVAFQGNPFTKWPPLHPTILAVPRLFFDIDPFLSGWGLNAFMFVGVIFLSGVLLYQLVPERRGWAYLAAVSVALSASIFSLAINHSTDVIFIFLVLLFLVVFHRYAQSKSLRALVAMITIAGLAAIERYIGVALILTGCIGILYVHRSELKSGILRSFLFGLASVTPLLLWFARNYWIERTIIGERNPTQWLLNENVRDGIVRIGRWYLPFDLLQQPWVWLLISVLLLLSFSGKGRELWRGLIDRLRQPTLFTAAVFIVVYLGAVFVLTKTEDHWQFYDDRYYTPVFTLNLLFFALIVETLVIRRLRKDIKAPGLFILAIVLGFWLLYLLSGTYKLASQSAFDRGVSYYNLYNAPRFRDSYVTTELLQILPDEEGLLYSNQSAAVSFFTRRNATVSPFRETFDGARVRLGAYRGEWPESYPALLIWYEPNYKEHVYTPEELKSIVEMTVLFSSSSGSIYRIEGPAHEED